MVDQQAGKIVQLKTGLFLETNDPNNAGQKLQIPVKSIPVLAKVADLKVGAEVQVLLSRPVQSIVSVVLRNIGGLCYVPVPDMYMAAGIEPHMGNALAKALYDKKIIDKAVYEKLQMT